MPNAQKPFKPDLEALNHAAARHAYGTALNMPERSPYQKAHKARLVKQRGEALNAARKALDAKRGMVKESDGASLLTHHYGRHIGLNADWNSRTWKVKGASYLSDKEPEGHHIHDNEDGSFTLAHNKLKHPGDSEIVSHEIAHGSAEHVHAAAQKLLHPRP